jgi:hypothetical protein
MREYCADFETNTYIDDCHVWAWGAADICENPEDTFEYGTSLDEFMEHVFAHPGRYWFHNLKFDGSFITSWLLSHGYEHTEDRPRAGQFSALIDDLGKFYSIAVATKVKFADSYKKITMPVRAVAKTYGLEMSKGEIDYNRYRPVGHELTVEELDYLQRDVLIMAQAMNVRLLTGTKLTTSSDCLEIFRDLYGKKRYRATMPIINGVIDAAMRRAYRGGWVYVNPKHKGEDVGRGIRLDVNSLYPWAMRYNPLPVGNPSYFSGKPSPTPERPLWIAGVTITARLKPGKLPCIQLKGSSIFGEREYTNSVPEPTPLVVCSVDYELWCEMYDIEVWSWDGGWSFAQREGVFDDYIDTYMKQKQNARTPGERAESKLMLNGLYGKLAQKILQRGQVPALDSDGVLCFLEGKESEREPVYLPMGIFITAYARRKTILTACEFGDRFCYADTDSIHAIGVEIPEDVEIHPKKLGAWKHEATFERARFVRAKTYVETVDGEEEYTCAGMSQSLKDIMRWEDFKGGFQTTACPFYHPGGCGEDCETCYSNTRNWGLKPKQVRGGVVLLPSPFSIR